MTIAVAERRKKGGKPPAPGATRPRGPVALEVSPTEVVPAVCAAHARKLSSSGTLPFCLVDSRPAAIAGTNQPNLMLLLWEYQTTHSMTTLLTPAEQGRFPAAVALGPEKLRDPDELQRLTDTFETLRSSVHVCVMVSRG